MPTPPHLLLVFSLVACDQPAEPSTHTLDRERYSESARTMKQDVEKAAALCLQIEDTVLQGECATFAAKRLAGQRFDPLPLCAQVVHKGWQQVCYFEASDGAGLVGEEAISACGRSGEFIERCLSHGLSRHADRDWRNVALGQEGEFLAWLEVQIPLYGLQDGFQDVRKDFLARRIADRLRRSNQAAFSTAACGEAPADTCAEVYRYLVRGASRELDVATFCAQPITDEALAAAKLPTWPDGDPAVVADLWSRMCRELQGPGRPPPHLPPN